MDADLELRTLAAEDDHWWYRGRRAIVLDFARRLAGADARMLDAGCGGGRVMQELAPLGSVVGIEPSLVSRRRALARAVGDVVDSTLESLPFGDGHFDLALTLDVLEHLDDDREGLAELHRVVKPGGSLIVTVPAHPRLWSSHDDANHHRRRYTRSSLAAAAQATGWEPRKLTHFNTLLLPVALAARRAISDDGLSIPPAPVNRVLESALQAERLAIRAGARLPVGLSLLAELRR